eukprot:Rhum_TRINITY_DN4408_c0_g1::Rhum_TRINITY_DN4408_c0_g1_i1::g.14285::m.14285
MFPSVAARAATRRCALACTTRTFTTTTTTSPHHPPPSSAASPPPLTRSARRHASSEPAWAAAAREKYEEEQRRKAARKAAAAREREAEAAAEAAELGDDVLAADVVSGAAASDALPVVEADGWLLFQNHDSFPRDVAEQWSPAAESVAGAGLRSEEEAKYHCEKMGYGGFIKKWSMLYFFKQHHPRRLVAARQLCEKADKGMYDLFVAPGLGGLPTLHGELKARYEAAVERGETPVKMDMADMVPDLDDEGLDDGIDGLDGIDGIGDSGSEGGSPLFAGKEDENAGVHEPATASEVPVSADGESTKGERPLFGGKEDEDEWVREPFVVSQKQHEADAWAPEDTVVARRDIKVGGVVAVSAGTEGRVVGPATSGKPNRVEVSFSQRADGRTKSMNVPNKELARSEE